MRITFLGYGSRGDVEPLLSIALEAKRRGHLPIFAAPSDFQEMIKLVELPFVKLEGNIQSILTSKEGLDLLAKGDSHRFLESISAVLQRYYKKIEEASLEACRGADLIVVGNLGLKEALCISAKFSIPAFVMSTFPAFPYTEEFPNFFITNKNLRLKWFNRWTYSLFDRVYWRNNKKYVDEFCEQLELQRFRGPMVKELMERKIRFLNMFSPLLVPTPKDWLETSVSCGRAYQDTKIKAAEKASPELVSWLQQGAKPVFFGFGSMPLLSSKEMFQTILNVLAETGQRGIISTGWSSAPLGKYPRDVFVVKSADYDWLFPQCIAAVHHGGCGTVHDSLRAGLPTVICAVISDQFYWGERVKSLGVGTWLNLKHFSHQRLLNGLKFCLEPSTLIRAQELSKKMRLEVNGAIKVVDFFEKVDFK